MTRLGRLVAYLRERDWDEQINFSIMVYRLDDAQLQEALYGPPPELARPPTTPLQDIEP